MKRTLSTINTISIYDSKFQMSCLFLHTWMLTLESTYHNISSTTWLIDNVRFQSSTSCDNCYDKDCSCEWFDMHLSIQFYNVNSRCCQKQFFKLCFQLFLFLYFWYVQFELVYLSLCSIFARDLLNLKRFDIVKAIFDCLTWSIISFTKFLSCVSILKVSILSNVQSLRWWATK